MVSTKEHLQHVLNEKFDIGQHFDLSTVYDFVLNQEYDPEIYKGIEFPKETVRANLQTLRDQGLITFEDNNGTYYRNELKGLNIDDPDFFSLEQLKKYGRLKLPAPNINFVEWAVLHKDEVLSHTVARQLGIKCQTRVGESLFPRTIREIETSIDEEGYDYRAWQPAVSRLDDFIHHKGKTYKYIVREGNNRYETRWRYFPCGIIEGDSEFALRQFGAISNTPNREKKNDCTPADVKSIIQDGFECGEIDKNEIAVLNHLKTYFKEVRKKDRRIFVGEILNEVGIKCEIETYDISKAQKHLRDNYGIEDVEGDVANMSVDQTLFCMGWGRKPDHFRKHYLIINKQLEFPENDYTMYGWLESGQGVTTDPTPENVDEKRIILEGDRKEHIQYCHKVVKAYQKGTLKPLNVRWMAQANETEPHNEFQ